jgi:putative solute:sodium symporter small subunit
LRDSGQESWWRRSTRLAATALGAATVVLVVPWLLGLILPDRTALGLPFPYFLFVVIAPLVLLGLVFWFARRQLALDYRYDVTGNQD